MSVAKTILYDDHNNVLILRRSGTHPYYAFQSDLPGGIVDSGESPLGAAVREVAEETGLKLSQGGFTQALHYRTPFGRDDFLFEARVTGSSPEVTISWEHDRFEWVVVNGLITRKLPERVDPYYKMVIEYLRKKSHT